MRRTSYQFFVTMWQQRKVKDSIIAGLARHYCGNTNLKLTRKVLSGSCSPVADWAPFNHTFDFRPCSGIYVIASCASPALPRICPFLTIADTTLWSFTSLYMRQTQTPLSSHRPGTAGPPASRLSCALESRYGTLPEWIR